MRSSGGDFLLLLVDVDDTGVFTLHYDKGGTTTSFLLMMVDVNDAAVFPMPCDAQGTVASVLLMLIDIDNVTVSTLHFDARCTAACCTGEGTRHLSARHCSGAESKVVEAGNR